MKSHEIKVSCIKISFTKDSELTLYDSYFSKISMRSYKIYQENVTVLDVGKHVIFKLKHPFLVSWFTL